MDESDSGSSPQPAPNTVTEALQLLRTLGYSADFELDGDELRSTAGDAPCPVNEAVVEHLYRFEGPSDPGDEMIVFGLRDPGSGRRGVLASGFGPAADPELPDHVRGFAARFERG